MYEYYNYENKALIEEREKLQAEMKARAIKEKKAEKKAKRNKVLMSAVYGLVFGIVAGGAFQGISLAGDIVRSQLGINESVQTVPADEDVKNQKKAELNKTDEVAETPVIKNDVPEARKLEKSGNLGVADVAENVMPSIVSITNKSVQEVRSMFGRGIREYESESCGSGIVIGKNDDELLIVTNNHVVENAKTLTVGFVDDEVYEAITKGTDPEMDIAVIAVKLSDIKDSTMEKIAIAKIGSSDELVIGEQVVAIGNALGYGQSVTTGIVSALDREVGIDHLANELIQTDAAINPGNSGGALVNMKGQVIGINTMKMSNTLGQATVEGLGFAIPSVLVSEIVEQLITQGYVSGRPTLGFEYETVSSFYQMYYGIPSGVIVDEIDDGSNAAEAGLEKSDIIMYFENQRVRNVEDMRTMLYKFDAGDTVHLVVYRRSGQVVIEMVLEEAKK